MANEILDDLLKQYEHKKFQAELERDKRKNELYKSVPRLQEIEDKLNKMSFSTAKNILNNSQENLDNFYKKIEELKKEKEKLLLSLGYDENYLNPNYECSICNDTGYFLDNNYKTQMCNCLKQKLLNESFNKSNISNLEKENFSKFDELLFSDEVDLSKYKFNISPRKNIINIKNNCIKFVQNFDDPASKNLLFSGNTGLRKDIYVKLYCL